MQELIRRGGPKDLALAQELMKQLSGAVSFPFSLISVLLHPLRSPVLCLCPSSPAHSVHLQEPEKQPDYEAQTKKELEKVQGKAILLNDMLNNVNEGERVGVDGDAYEVCSRSHFAPSKS